MPIQQAVRTGSDAVHGKGGSVRFVHMSTPPPPAAFQLNLPDTGATMVVPAGATLLQAMHGTGATWPASCRNGTCRACIGLLVSGTVRYTVEWPGLLPEEKRQGGVLPCVACPTSDVVLAPLVD